MIWDILLLYARDSEHIKNDLLLKLRCVPVLCTCIDDPDFLSEEKLKSLTQIKLQVVFFSPDFVKFLECRIQEAYAYFCSVEPQATVALFCCGLRQGDIYCYHKTPLISYSSWPKFEHTDGQLESSEFSPYFMGMFQEFLPDQNRPTESLVIVPQIITKESNSVYIVFSEAIENMEEIFVHFEIGSRIQIVPECINPHVLHFKVPVALLESHLSLKVKIQRHDKVLARQVLSVVPSITASNKGLEIENAAQKRLEKDQRAAEYELDMRDENIRGSKDSLLTISPDEDVTMNYEDMSSRPVYEEPKLFGCLNYSEHIKQSYFLRKDTSETQVNLQEDTDDTDEFPVVCRSVSLPSIIPEQEKYYNYDPVYEYMPMAPIYQHLRENNCFQSSKNVYLNESSYIYVKPDGNAGNQLDIASRDFQENPRQLGTAMQTFKSNASRNAEEKYRIRQKRVVESPSSSGNDEQGEMTWRNSPFTRDFKRKGLRRSKLQQTLDTDPEMDSKRNSFNDSASSSSSKTSENSPCIVQPFRNHESTTEVPAKPTSLFLNNPSPRMYPRAKPCPLPKPPTGKEDSALYRTNSARRKNGTSQPPGFLEQDSSVEDQDKVKSLIKVCERYGLQHLSNYFISSGCYDNLDDLYDDNLQDTEDETTLNMEYFQVSGWDQENTVSLQRSMSLPSTLFPSQPSGHSGDNSDESYDDVRYEDDSPDTKNCKLGDYLSTIPSGIYMSIIHSKIGNIGDEPGRPGCTVETRQSKNDHRSLQSGIYMSLIPFDSKETVKNCPLQRTGVSKSQEELLELMEAYKRGDKSISLVEQQFQQWHLRHMASPSDRDKQLVCLKDAYKRVQKPNKSRIKEFIIGKTRKDSKKTTDENAGFVRKKLGKTKSETKRLSKISSASTSSGGMSDNSDVSKFCFGNPGYGEIQPIRGNNGRKVFCPPLPPPLPPPVPPRPPLTPVAVMQTLLFNPKLQNKGVSDGERNRTPSQTELPQLVQKKPSPPPKPAHVLKKLKCDCPDNGSDTNQNHETEQAAENPDNRPVSPVYIIPEEAYYIPSGKKNRPHKPNPGCLLHSQLPPAHSCPRAPGDSYDSSSCPTTIMRPKEVCKDSSKRRSWTLQVKDAIQNQIVEIATQLVKPKKVEEAKFYVTRKWSSYPKLDSSEMPVYLDLLEHSENRVRSISDSNPPVDCSGLN